MIKCRGEYWRMGVCLLAGREWDTSDRVRRDCPEQGASTENLSVSRNFQKCPGGAWRVGGKQAGPGIGRNSGKGWTGLIWETWKVEWLCRDAGSLSLTAEGLVMVSISYGPMKRGTSLGEGVHREMSLADSHTFCPRWYVTLRRPAGVPRSGGGPLALWSRRADSAVGDAARIGWMGNSVSFSGNKSGW